jgi:Ribbon-helix-helix protein, copG family
MVTVRRTISLPPALDDRLAREAKRRKSSVSAVIADMVGHEPAPLPYVGLIDDDQDLSLRVEEVLARLDK